MPPKFVFSIVVGRVEETNGAQSCPNKTYALLLSLKRRSMRAQASRSDGWLDRTDEIFRLFTLVKSPSKSNSIRPVITVFGAGSSHSKLAPSLSARAFR